MKVEQPMYDVAHKATTENLEQGLASLLGDLAQLQDELLAVLTAKRERIAANDMAGLGPLNDLAAKLCGRLEDCQNRRQNLLAAAEQAGTPVENLGKLTAILPRESREGMGKQAKEIGSRMRLLQHQCLTNWVIAQRSLLHMSQLIEIIASGGRLQPTYGTGVGTLAGGALLDSEA